MSISLPAHRHSVMLRLWLRKGIRSQSARLHGRERHTVSSLLLGLVERVIGTLDQALGIGPALRDTGRDTQAQCYPVGLDPWRMRDAQGLDLETQSLGHMHGTGLIRFR